MEALSPASESVELKARQLLRRYGILFPELLAREPMAPRWRDMVRILRRMEAKGEIRGGRFVSGFIGEQFALPEAVEALRASKKQGFTGRHLVVSGCDPLNLAGILTPGERVPAVLGNRVVFRDGVPQCSLESGNLIDRLPVVRSKAEDGQLAEARALLRLAPGSGSLDSSSWQLRQAR